MKRDWESDRLTECERSLGRKCYPLDHAELAHGVQVVVYAPEGFEHEGTLHTDTRVSVFVAGEEQARMTCIVDQHSESVQAILARHA